MIKAFLPEHHRGLTFALLGTCLITACAAGIVGIEDNAPGILLAFCSSAILTIAFTHPWQCAKPYAFLLLSSVAAFVAFAFLHNVLHGLSNLLEDLQPLGIIVEALGVIPFLISILICPPAAIVGLVGMITLLIKNHYHKKHHPPLIY